MAGRLALAAIALASFSADASGQVFGVRDAPRRGSWEAGGGASWTTSVDGPELTAELIRNGETTGGFDLFTASGRLENGAGVDVTLGYYVSRAVLLEAGLRYSKPRLTYTLGDDFESAPQVTAEETLSRYVISGAVVLHLRKRGRAVPFVTAGLGHVRDLHEEGALVETGTQYRAGGGIKYWLGDGRRRLGVRGQIDIAITDGGFDLREDRSRTLPVVSGSIVYLF